MLVDVPEVGKYALVETQAWLSRVGHTVCLQVGCPGDDLDRSVDDRRHGQDDGWSPGSRIVPVQQRVHPVQARPQPGGRDWTQARSAARTTRAASCRVPRIASPERGLESAAVAGFGQHGTRATPRRRGDAPLFAGRGQPAGVRRLDGVCGRRARPTKEPEPSD